jgi:UDP-N-acetylmuramate--alanine ligase
MDDKPMDRLYSHDNVFGVIGVCGVVGNLVARALTDNGFKVLGTDAQDDINCKFKYTLDDYNFPLFLGGHPNSFFARSDYIIPPPSLPEDSALRQKLEDYKIRDNYHLLEVDDVFKFIKPGKPVLCITGTNGKTTTVSLLKHICASSGLKPAEHGFQDLQGNIEYIPPLQCRLKGDVAILETGTFGYPGDLKFIIERSSPDCGLITNITPDHMPTGQDFLKYASIKGEFVDYLKNKKLIVNADDPTVWGLVTSKFKAHQLGDVITFGVDTSENKINEKKCWCGKNIRIDETITGMGDYHCSCGLKKPEIQYLANDISEKRFTILTPHQRLEVETPLIGLHNIYNTLGAIVAAYEYFKIPFDQIINSVKNFNGVPGRLDYVGHYHDKDVIIDYAHNPGGVETVLGELKKIYKELAVVITISSESGEEGDLDIFKKCVDISSCVIPASYYSRKAADKYIELSKNDELKGNIIFPPKYPKEFKKGTLGANFEQIKLGLETGLECDVEAVICLGEAAFKFKDDVKKMIIKSIP